jgi:hypothetical protein
VRVEKGCINLNCIFTVVTHYLDLLQTVLLSGYSSYLFFSALNRDCSICMD